MTTTGYPTAALRESGALPAGVSFIDNGDGTATLLGTPATGSAGTYPISFTATSTAGTASQSFVLTNASAPSITSPAAATFTSTQPASYTVTTTGYPAPAITETGALPPRGDFTDNGDGTATIRAPRQRGPLGPTT